MSIRVIDYVMFTDNPVQSQMALFTCPRQRPNSAHDTQLAATFRDFDYSVAFEK